MTFDPKNDVRDSRPDCMKTGSRQHKWKFDEATGIGKCDRQGCPATIDVNAKISKEVPSASS